MKPIGLRSVIVACVASLSTPTGSWGHAGHGPEHGWLAGAVQPFASPDHMAAGVFATLVAALGLWLLSRAVARRRAFAVR